ncbi:T9SS type A sorting domain-containing protein [uncultured Flavobacterium sp.]|mgnify:CR=1 FL=1|uniref:T9SS type A sorting domain-containing protein n=1 Tax=uncultured Flavobacterium sp. TaxID=165435 RepID=UPI0025F3976A|nr:T9SS type A sorting domain-containing protein [uncultured Flavobacterium sp.]
MIKKLPLILIAFVCFQAKAQFTTPNTGVIWGLDDLLTNAPSALSFSNGIYTLSQNLTIAQNDTFVIDENAEIHINADISFTVAGNFTADAPAITITATNTATPYNTITFQEFSNVFLRNVKIDYGKGIRASSGNFEMQSCSMSYHKQGSTASSAIAFSQGSPIVNNSRFTFNDYPALGSGANQLVSAVITNNYIEGNNISNGNRPQINMGPSGDNTLRIIGNTIKGNRALTKTGGISAASLLGITNRVIIDNNIITDNRYGINVQGATSSGYIRGNIIEDNNTENLPNSGGSGISLSASATSPIMNVIASGNQIRGNLWGITVIGQARINLGNTDLGNLNEGKNVFSNNGNGGAIYALYNNTAFPIIAMNNCWIEGNNSPTPQQVEDVIWHQVDTATLGLVTFTPYGCEALSVPEKSISKLSIYPNPSSGKFTLTVEENGTMEAYSINGQLVATKKLMAGENTFQIDLPSGMYILQTKTETKKFTNKLIMD